MATIVDRPVSAMSSGLDPVAPQRRARDVEIIDVDSLDDATIPASRRTSAQPQPVPLPRGTHSVNGTLEPEGIIVLDSDEDELAMRTSAAARRVVNPRISSRSRLFSPPPQPYRPSPVPPVPPVPPRYASHTSLPARQWSPSVHLPPVRPINRPFDFEARNNPRAAGPSVSRRPPRRSPPLHASATSHHVPSMGLGGALISSYREPQRPPNPPQPGLLARAGAAASGFANRLSRNLVGMGMAPDMTLNFGSHDDNALAQLLVETEMQELFGDLNHRHLLRHLSRDRHPQSTTYQTAYTHSHPTEAGFTNDFASEATPTTPQRRKSSGPIIIDDDESASSSKQAHWASSPDSVKPSTVLACARCLDPLVLGTGLVGDEGDRRKIWALRCGHMIDGKCLMEIGHPPDATDGEPTKTDVKGKGKARASPAKGKGKANVKVAEDSATERENDNSSASLASMVVETNSIRSRLRSSRTLSIGSVPDLPLPLPSLSSSAATRRKRPRKPKIEGEYQYECPVSGCKHIHVSIKINGRWRPERDDDRKKPGGRRTVKFPHDLGVDIDGGVDVRGRGAIPVFV